MVSVRLSKYTGTSPTDALKLEAPPQPPRIGDVVSRIGVAVSSVPSKKQRNAFALAITFMWCQLFAVGTPPGRMFVVQLARSGSGAPATNLRKRSRNKPGLITNWLNVWKPSEGSARRTRPTRVLPAPVKKSLSQL